MFCRFEIFIGLVLTATTAKRVAKSVLEIMVLRNRAGDGLEETDSIVCGQSYRKA